LVLWIRRRKTRRSGGFQAHGVWRIAHGGL